MTPIRIFYAKTGRAKYLSHLDVMRAFSRAIKRSELPVWYTQGFNPHLYLTFALPLSLGYEGMTETVDIRLERELSMEEVAARLAPCLPDGFQVLWAAPPQQEPSAIAWADYEVELAFDSGDPGPMEEALSRLLSKDELLVLKKAKKGPGKKVLKEVDIRPQVELRKQRMQGNSLYMTLRLRTGITQNLNPALFLEALYKEARLAPDLVRIARVRVLDEQLCEFA